MHTSTLIISILAASAHARFGQEQLPIPPIRDVTSGGAAGVAATLAGAAISDLLGAANPCGKLAKADEIIAKLGTGDDAIAAAIGLVQAEQNFNPFAVDRPFICGDASLPKTEVLRGRTPLVDPQVEGSEAANALMVKSKASPLANKGKSVAQIMADNGFTNLVAKDLAGNVVQIGAGGGGGAEEVVDQQPVEEPVKEKPEVVDTTTVADVTSPTAPACEAVTTFITVTRDPAVAPTATAEPAIPVVGDDTQDQVDTEQPATGGNNQVPNGVDFGACIPTMDFVGGRNGRKATEFTFLPTDELVAKGQQEALNPNIITNRICDQLINVCEANKAAHDLCLDAKAKVLASGLRDASVVETWNAALGFAGAVPEAPAAPVVVDEVDASATGSDNNTSGVGGASGGADFGLCVPTMDFVGGRNGRKATEFTFLPTDNLVKQGQQEALNPNIITNRICDQLTNVCKANQAAKDLCSDAKAQVLASGLRDASVVETWNSALGFAGAVAPAPAPVEDDVAAPATGGDGADNNTGGGVNGAADFGLCIPTMDFVGGRNGRKATEFTFLPTDDLVAKGQQEALNPNIITNRICDQLTNVCEANQAAKDLCLSAKAKILADGARDASVVTTWNGLLGF